MRTEKDQSDLTRRAYCLCKVTSDEVATHSEERRKEKESCLVTNLLFTAMA